MESNAFSGYVSTRSSDFLSGVNMGTAPRGNIGSALAPQTPSVSFSRAQSKYPLFVASSDGMNRQERPSLRQKLQIALLLFSRRVSQMARKVRLPLAVMMAAWTLNFGGLSPMPAHAAKATAPTVSSRPLRSAKNQKSPDAEKSASGMDVHKKRAVVALGFGGSLYSVVTRRKRGFGQTETDSDAQTEAPALEVVEKLTLEDLEEKTLEASTTAEETGESTVISSDAASSSTSNKVVAKKEGKDGNPIVEFLDTVGANPEVVFGFLGSSLSFAVSDNILISGIAFAWIFKLFKDSETPDADADNDDEEVIAEIEEEAIAEIEEEEQVEAAVIEAKAPVEEEKVDETVVLEEYRPEELMAEASTVAEESHKVPEEIIEKVVVQTNAEIQDIEVTNDVDEAEGEEEEAVPDQQEKMEEVVAEEISEPIVQEQEPAILTMDHSTDAEEKMEHLQVASTSTQKMSIGDRAYKVVVDLGLIEWDRKRREKN
eukprot:CAMPEP_0113651344 /NCGR_PEP_ID=MMETSP0017_2-20120614/27359_1 /TAXON_ID=2856 /ORGANISM="Cylindrotheca closterium" /LENGTH=485 /DNA_ID=CAMNT_0000563991 /DNA_START=69 /DNA_END=1526 /DNA_ORIENTATION=- /assembly_acc=CAM_ASM_000147